jgi:crossover junction endodeoxyribonuclease RuvC
VVNRVLGIDPGSRVTGLGIVDLGPGGLRHVHSECLRLPGDDLAPRLKRIYDGVSAVIREHAPDVVVVEKVFMSRNVHSALVLGHARGSAICAAVTRDVPVFEYSAREVKRAVVGTGSADKAQVQHMIRVLLGLDAEPPADAADALACAICHIHLAEGNRRRSRALDIA